MAMAAWKGENGRQYVLTREIGSGGEGTVYAIYGDTQNVAKIYREDRFPTEAARETARRKLQAMLRIKARELLQSSIFKKQENGKLKLAWPKDILFDVNGRLAGFVMPKVEAQYKIYDFYRTVDRDRIFGPGGYNWRYSVQIARDLASAVSCLHGQNIILGDMNSENIAYDLKSGTIALFDCDSFDITDPYTEEHFPCAVGQPEILAPELQIPDLAKGHFCKESDNFSLAIYIFRLLMNNTDPFGCKIETGSDGAGQGSLENEAIVNGYCPYVRDLSAQHRSVPPYAPPFDLLPPDVRMLFRTTFSYTKSNATAMVGRRATAEEWAATLSPYAAPGRNARLKTCTQDRSHVYAANNRSCPWCAHEKKMRELLNPAGNTTGAGTQTQAVRTGRRYKNQGGRPRRSAWLFYILLIACGVDSGVFAGNVLSQILSAQYGTMLEPFGCCVILGVMGFFTAVVIAGIFRKKYTHARHGLPWLLLAVPTAAIPVGLAGLFHMFAGIFMNMVGSGF